MAESTSVFSDDMLGPEAKEIPENPLVDGRKTKVLP